MKGRTLGFWQAEEGLKATTAISEQPSQHQLPSIQARPHPPRHLEGWAPGKDVTPQQQISQADSSSQQGSGHRQGRVRPGSPGAWKQEVADLPHEASNGEADQDEGMGHQGEGRARPGSPGVSRTSPGLPRKAVIEGREVEGGELALQPANEQVRG